jgi:hypothetical protein
MLRKGTPLWYLVPLALFCSLLAQPAQSSPREHDSGFFLRLSGGLGSARTEVEPLGKSIELSGGAADFNFAIGGIVSPNLALHGTLFGWAIEDPTVEVIGYELGTANVDLTLAAIGAGITYYLMPANFYLSPSVGFGSLTIDGLGVVAESDEGVVMDLTGGKEWWVGDNWGLGVAASVGFHSVPDGLINENWSGVSLAIRFTATLN